jgi:hypothetical protein
MQTAASSIPVARKSPRRWYLLGGFVVLLIATPFGLQFFAGWQRDRELEEIYRELDAEDPHWRWPDLVAQIPPAPPDDRNAAVQMVKVHELLQKTGFTPGKSKQGPLNSRLSEKDSHNLRSALDKVPAGVLDEARKLKGLPEGRVAVEPSENPFDVLGSDSLSGMRAPMMLLRDDAILRGHSRDLAGAAESCLALLNAAHALNDFPSLRAQFVRTAGQERALHALERTLGQGSISDRHLEQLQTAFTREAEHPAFYHAMRGERAAGHQLFLLVRDGKASNPGVYGSDEPTKILRPLYSLFPNLSLRDYPEYLRIQNELVRAGKQHGEARCEAFRELEKKLASGSSLSFMMGWAKELEVSQVRLHCAVAAIAAERYRLKYNVWPRRLDDVVKSGYLKEISKDPYDGQPLRWKRTTTGVIVYSVGEDQIDNGGTLDRANPRAAGSDIGFELWDRRGVPSPADGNTP